MRPPHIGTVAELYAVVGAPAPGTEIRHRADYGMSATSWPGTVDGRAGWWWAVTRDGLVVALGWTAGDHLARDVRLGRVMAAGWSAVRA